MRKNLIIPASGKSSRFPNTKPKWLLTHPESQIMIDKILTEELVHSHDNIYITIVKKHVEKYDALQILRDVIEERKLEHKITISILDNFTSSAAETVFHTIKKHNIEGSITIKDSDCYVDFKIPKINSFILGVNIEKHNINNPSSKSYIIKDDNDIIQDIFEKRVVSKNICVGVYGFPTTNAFIDSYNALKDYTKEELYVSHVMSHFINYSDTFVQYVEAELFVDWGTINEWKEEQQKYITYFFDIDGVICKNVGKYGTKNWYNSTELIDSNVDKLLQIQKNKGRIVLATSRDKKAVNIVIDLLSKRGINIPERDIITDCYHSKRVIVNDFAPTNPYPSCEAVNLPRNGSIEDYI